jgi:hypothetical protein
MVIGVVIVVVLLVAILGRRCRGREPRKEEPPTDDTQRPASWPGDKEIIKVEPEPAESISGDDIHLGAMSTPLNERQQEGSMPSAHW